MERLILLEGMTDKRYFLLLQIPKYLNEHQQDLLYKIFDNMFRQVSESRVEERLGLNKIDKKQLL